MGGGKVAYYRRQAGLSQTELARRTGLRQSWISDLERGHYDVQNMTLRNAVRLAMVLHVHAEDLLDELPRLGEADTRGARDAQEENKREHTDSEKGT